MTSVDKFVVEVLTTALPSCGCYAEQVGIDNKLIDKGCSQMSVVVLA